MAFITFLNLNPMKIKITSPGMGQVHFNPFIDGKSHDIIRDVTDFNNTNPPIPAITQTGAFSGEVGSEWEASEMWQRQGIREPLLWHNCPLNKPDWAISRGIETRRVWLVTEPNVSIINEVDNLQHVDSEGKNHTEKVTEPKETDEYKPLMELKPKVEKVETVGQMAFYYMMNTTLQYDGENDAINGYIAGYTAASTKTVSRDEVVKLVEKEIERVKLTFPSEFKDGYIKGLVTINQLIKAL